METELELLLEKAIERGPFLLRGLTWPEAIRADPNAALEFGLRFARKLDDEVLAEDFVEWLEDAAAGVYGQGALGREEISQHLRRHEEVKQVQGPSVHWINNYLRTEDSPKPSPELQSGGSEGAGNGAVPPEGPGPHDPLPPTQGEIQACLEALSGRISGFANALSAGDFENARFELLMARSSSGLALLKMEALLHYCERIGLSVSETQ